ncbi:GapR family DNA-binding domain-containing protein [Shinella pollutisoli]|uniref:GapR family DNA-binding domain-containing protein n=1 Tax=Shinella pollutisoli TaxID=2250594 RepID=A0ABV7DBS6_9HYPH|nr:GapR family DNA-binding domain-containing protein [Shinella pollutisoli]
MSADAKLKAYIDRILRCREAEDAAKEDTKAVYAELAGDGYEKAIVGQVVTFLRKREKDSDKVAEQSAKFDLYLEAYERPSHAHTREDRSDAGLNILTKHTEITASDGASPAVRQLAGSARDEESAASYSEMDRATEGSFETGSEAAEKGRKAIPAGPEGADLNHAGAGESPATDQPLVGGDHEVTGIASRERDMDPTSNTGEGAACALPDISGVTMEYVPPCGMKRPPFAQCFPDLSKADYDKLERDIAANRVKAPIIRKGDVILDGWNRYTIARKYGMDYPVREYTGTDVLLDVIEWQRASRHFTPAQEKKIAADLAKEIPHRADDIFAAFRLAEALEAAQ